MSMSCPYIVCTRSHNPLLALVLFYSIVLLCARHWLLRLTFRSRQLQHAAHLAFSSSPAGCIVVVQIGPIQSPPYPTLSTARVLPRKLP
jgi:hypothetical protein